VVEGRVRRRERKVEERRTGGRNKRARREKDKDKEGRGRDKPSQLM
jgi:hypothetical protein